MAFALGGAGRKRSAEEANFGGDEARYAARARSEAVEAAAEVVSRARPELTLTWQQEILAAIDAVPLDKRTEMDTRLATLIREHHITDFAGFARVVQQLKMSGSL